MDIYSQIAFLNPKLREKIFKLNYALIREVNEVSLLVKEYIILVFCTGHWPWNFWFFLGLGMLPWNFMFFVCLGMLPWNFVFDK